jgi:hypothetical protein
MAKLSISDAWDDSKRVIASDGRLMIAVALALFVLPGIVLDFVVPAAPAGEFPPAGPWMIVLGVVVVVALIGQLAIVRLAMGPHLTVGEAITHGVRRFPAYLLATIIWTAPFTIATWLFATQVSSNPAKPPPAAALGFLVTLIVMLFFAIRMIATSPVASAEAVGPIAIIRRSWELTRGSWWRLFGFFLIFMIGSVCLFWAVQSVLGLLASTLLGGTSGHSLGWLAVRLVSQLISAVISVAFFVMLARIYVQLAGGGEVQASVPKSGT